MLPLVMSVFLLAEIALAVPPPVADESLALRQWVLDLDSDEFITREEATQKLMKAGSPAIAIVEELLPQVSLEGTTRSLLVLRELGQAKELDTQDLARAALLRLSQAKTAVSGRAGETLAVLDRERSSRAVTDLERLGAVIEDQTLGGGESLKVVEIGPAWKGEVKDLRRLQWLEGVIRIELIGPAITDEVLLAATKIVGLQSLHLYEAKVTDEGLAVLTTMPTLRELGLYYMPTSDAAITHLEKLPLVATIKFYGTDISPEAKDKLGKTLRIAGIDYKRGGFLGIGGGQLDDECVITQVHEGSPADKAGFLQGDVLMEFDSQPVKDFRGLQDLIAEHKSDEKIPVKLRRRNEDGKLGSRELTLEVTLARWDAKLASQNRQR